MKSATITLTEMEISTFASIIEHMNYGKYPGDEKWNNMSIDDKAIFLVIQENLLSILDKIGKSKLK